MKSGRDTDNLNNGRVVMVGPFATPVTLVSLLNLPVVKFSIKILKTINKLFAYQ